MSASRSVLFSMQHDRDTLLALLGSGTVSDVLLWTTRVTYSPGRTSVTFDFVREWHGMTGECLGDSSLRCGLVKVSVTSMYVRTLDNPLVVVRGHSNL